MTQENNVKMQWYHYNIIALLYWILAVELNPPFGIILCIFGAYYAAEGLYKQVFSK